MKEEASLNNNSREGNSGFPSLANVPINTRIVTQEDFENNLQPLTGDLSKLSGDVNRLSDDVSQLSISTAGALSGISRIDNELSGFATVAKTGSYNDLKDKPTIPTIDLDDIPTLSSEKAVKSYGIAWAINESSRLLNERIDSTVDSIATALSGKADLSVLIEKADLSALASKADLSALERKVDATSEGNVASGKVVSDSIAEHAITAEKLDQSIIDELGEISTKANFDWVAEELEKKADADSVEQALSTKIDKVAGAASGNIALFGENGNLTDSQKAISSFATSEQGVRADNAISSVNGKRSTDGALTLNASEVGALANEGQVVLDGSLTISKQTETLDYVKYKHDGFAVYAGNGVHEISLPLSAGRLALESQLSAVQTSVSGVTGNFAGFDENNNLCDLGINAGAFATVSALNNLTDNMRSLADSLAELDTLKADTVIVDEIVENVEELSGSISGLNQTKADKTDINALSGNIRNLSNTLSNKTDLITTLNLSTDLQRQIWELSSYHRGGTATPLTLDPRKSYVMTDGTALSLELENQTGPGTVKICAYDADANEIPYDESAPGTIDGGSTIDWAPLDEVNARLNSISSVLDDRLGYIDEINGVLVLSSDGNVYINSTGDIILRKNLSEITRRDGEAEENETFSVIEQLRKMHDVENICLPLSGGIINVIDGLSTLTEKTRHQHAFEFDGAVEVLSVLDSPKPYIENGEQIYWAEKFGELYASDVDMFVQRGELNLSDVVALKLSADFAKLSGHFTLVIRTDKNDIKSGVNVTLSSHEKNKEFDFGTIDSYSISQTDTHSKSIWLNLSKTYFNKDRVNNAHLYYSEPENPWEIWDSWYRVINTEIPLGEDLTTHEFSAPYIAYWTDDPYVSSYQEDKVEFRPIEHKIITEQYVSTERVITNADLVEIYNEFESRDGKIGQLSASIQEENEARKKFVKMGEDSKISANVEFLGQITLDRTLNNINVNYPRIYNDGIRRRLEYNPSESRSLGSCLTYMNSIGIDTSSFDLIRDIISPAQLNPDTLSDCLEFIEYPDPDDPEFMHSRLCLKKIDPLYWGEAGHIPSYIQNYGEVEQLGELSTKLTYEDGDPLKYCLNYNHDVYGYENFPIADSIYIPNTVKIIGDYAFSYIRGSREISIPDSVTEIGKRAFHQSDISSIRLPKGLKDLSKGLFAGCYSLQSIEMPETIESIGSEAFSDVPFKGPIYIDENIKFISRFAFIMSPIDALYWKSTKNPLETLSNLIVLANEEHEDEWDENNNLSDSIHTIYYPCDIDTSAWPTEISGIVCKPKADFRLTTGTATIDSYKPRYEQDVVNKKYVDDLAAEIEAGIIPQSAIDGIVSACATKEYVNNSVAELASTDFVNRSISAFATNRYVDYALSGKAGVEYVDNAVAEISSQTVTTARFDETISSVTAAIDNVPTKEYVDNAVSSSTNDMVSRAFFDQTVSQLMGVINELSAKLQAIIDDDEPPTPPTPPQDGTFTWTDENGEHTEYLSSLNSFTWTDNAGAHYYCNEHGLDNPDCPEYQEIISGDTTEENVLAWTDHDGVHEATGPVVMAWADSNGSHTVTL